MKRIFSLLLVFIMVIFTGCSSSDNSTTDASKFPGVIFVDFNEVNKKTETIELDVSIGVDTQGGGFHDRLIAPESGYYSDYHDETSFPDNYDFKFEFSIKAPGFIINDDYEGEYNRTLLTENADDRETLSKFIYEIEWIKTMQNGKKGYLRKQTVQKFEKYSLTLSDENELTGEIVITLREIAYHIDGDENIYDGSYLFWSHVLLYEYDGENIVITSKSKDKTLQFYEDIN